MKTTKTQSRHSVQRLVGLLDDMLSNAQTLRIQQSQATSEAGWGKHLTEKADAAWQHLNEAHKAAMRIARATFVTTEDH